MLRQGAPGQQVRVRPLHVVDPRTFTPARGRQLLVPLVVDREQALAGHHQLYEPDEPGLLVGDEEMPDRPALAALLFAELPESRIGDAGSLLRVVQHGTLQGRASPPIDGNSYQTEPGDCNPPHRTCMCAVHGARFGGTGQGYRPEAVRIISRPVRSKVRNFRSIYLVRTAYSAQVRIKPGLSAQRIGEMPGGGYPQDYPQAWNARVRRNAE